MNDDDIIPLEETSFTDQRDAEKRDAVYHLAVVKPGKSAVEVYILSKPDDLDIGSDRIRLPRNDYEFIREEWCDFERDPDLYPNKLDASVLQRVRAYSPERLREVIEEFRDGKR